MSAENPRPFPGKHARAATTPELSVIISLYAADPESVRFLRVALDHLNASTFQDFEILVAGNIRSLRPSGSRYTAGWRRVSLRLLASFRSNGYLALWRGGSLQQEPSHLRDVPSREK